VPGDLITCDGPVRGTTVRRQELGKSVEYKVINTQEAQKQRFRALGKFEIVDRNFKRFSPRKPVRSRNLRGFFQG
jgi:hypothetical protein